MKYHEFLGELNKLVQRFDKKYYPQEVSNLLFEEVKSLDLHWLKKIISFFLASHKPALLPEFREHSRIEKDRIRTHRTQFGINHFENSESMFDREDIDFLFALTKRIAMDSIPDREEFVSTFNPVLERIIANKDKVMAKKLFKEVRDLYKI